ncbi:hypothetical protein CSQ92_27800 [Janthinobacterium sp. BJB446]|uniref:hypothetical protein n=1 Tax=Janthinobacterium sp. BJB446 TaxID=2048009 RepID=UPI000C11233E|nr:hypothetical protein [Janthinobacterium sp. BJB446]PHV19181.1 hypothetical protein CSQ92_27800 [Janthinobacterium sp. BJB446]
MKSRVLLLAAPIVLCALNGFARPLDATGACSSAGTLVAADMHVDPRMAAEIQRRAAQLPPWFSSVALSKNTFRLFRTANSDVFVLTRCNRMNCDAERAYIGFAPRSVGWGASLYLGAGVVELGRPVVPGAAQEIMPDDIAPAVICAQNLDWGN